MCLLKTPERAKHEAEIISSAKKPKISSPEPADVNNLTDVWQWDPITFEPVLENPDKRKAHLTSIESSGSTALIIK